PNRSRHCAPRRVAAPAAPRCPNDPSTRRFHKPTASSYPFLADAGSCPGNCSGMEDATGAPSSLADWNPRRLRASSRDGETVMTESPSAFTMLLSRHTRRREFIAGLGSAAAWPVMARAQQLVIPLVAFLNSGSPDGYGPMVAAFRQGLKEPGYVEGQNVAVE